MEGSEQMRNFFRNNTIINGFRIDILTKETRDKLIQTKEGEGIPRTARESREIIITKKESSIQFRDHHCDRRIHEDIFVLI
jgi:hypothetical protein